MLLLFRVYTLLLQPSLVHKAQDQDDVEQEQNCPTDGDADDDNQWNLARRPLQQGLASNHATLYNNEKEKKN